MQEVITVNCTRTLSNGIVIECPSVSIFTDYIMFFTNPVPLGLILGVAIFITGLILLVMAGIWVAVRRKTKEKTQRRHTMSNPMYIAEIDSGISGASRETDQAYEPYLSETGNEKQRNSEADIDYENVIEKHNRY